MSPALTGATAGVTVALALLAVQAARVAGRSEAVHARLWRADLAGAPQPGAPPAAPDRAHRRPGLRAPGWVRSHLDDAALPAAPGTLWTAWCCATATAVFAGGAVGGPPAALVVVAASTAAAAATVWARRGATGRMVERGLPDALDGLARAMRGGATTRQALSDVALATPGPLGHELQRAMAEVRAGSRLEVALMALQERRPAPSVRLAVAALLLGAEAGGAHARALEGVAASVRARFGVTAEVRALGSQARLSALVIAAAPLGFTGLAMGADGTSATFLLRTPLGLACLTLGLALDGVGAWWMHRLAQVDA